MLSGTWPDPQFFLQLLGGKIEFSDQNNKVCQYDPGAIQNSLIVGKINICFFLFWFRRTFVRKSESNWEVEKQLACLGRSSTKLPAKSQDHFLISYSVFMLLNKSVRFVPFWSFRKGDFSAHKILSNKQSCGPFLCGLGFLSENLNRLDTWGSKN